MLPTGASTFVESVDFVFLFIAAISIGLLLFITFLMVYFVVKYHRSKNTKPVNIHGNTLLEIVWTVLPTALVMMMFYYGWAGFVPMREVPKDAMKVKVIAQMWSWMFEYENGKISDRLIVPVNKPVYLALYSSDVLHSFYVPAFRVKEDVVPGRNQYTWFEATKMGSYDILCAEFCGERHAYMLGKVDVLNQAKFQEWYDKIDPAQAAGKRDLIKLKGCLACHTTDGTKLVGPSFKGMWGKTVKVKTDGKFRNIKRDEKYIERSIYFPNKDIVDGFQPMMPSQKGLVNEQELKRIIQQLKGFSE